MKIDIHNHTPLCNHASGSLEEYINQAINKKIDIFGFSDHAPTKSGFDQKYRMTIDQMQQYEKDILLLKEKYKKDIKILLGYEVDFIQNDIVNFSNNIDYLIGSVHFINKWGFDNPEYIKEYQSKNIDTIWQDYFQTLQNMVNAKLFDIVGHIDLIKIFKFYPTSNINTMIIPLLKSIKEANMVIEINSAGLRKPVQEAYPSFEILQICYNEGIDITFGSDAHSITQIGQNYDKIINIAKQAGYTHCVYFEKRKKIKVNF